MKDKQYVRVAALSTVAIISNVVAGVIWVLKGRWFIAAVHVVMIVMVTWSFLSYRKTHKEFLEWEKKLKNLRSENEV